MLNFFLGMTTGLCLLWIFQELQNYFQFRDPYKIPAHEIVRRNIKSYAKKNKDKKNMWKI